MMQRTFATLSAKSGTCHFEVERGHGGFRYTERVAIGKRDAKTGQRSLPLRLIFEPEQLCRIGHQDFPQLRLVRRVAIQEFKQIGIVGGLDA